MQPTQPTCIQPRSARRRRPRRLLVGIILAAALWVLLPSVASAHAHLVQADPAPGGVIARVPAVASFLFDEPLNPALTRVHLVDAAGRAVHTPRGYLAAGHGGELWRLPLPHLAAGTYSVFWTSESATDGHVMSSYYTFRVAASGAGSAMGAVHGAAAGAMGSGNTTLLDIGADAATTALFIWLGQMAQALWMGALIVELAVLARSRRSAIAQEAELARAATRRVWLLGVGALVGMLASLAGELLCLAAQGTGGDWSQALAPATLGGILSSQNGQFMAARFALLLGALGFSRQVKAPAYSAAGRILAWPERAASRPTQAVGIVAPAFIRPQWEAARLVLLGLAGVYMLLVALSGHAANVNPLWFSASVDWVHLVCTAAWVGGIAALAYGVVPFRHALAPEERAPAVLTLLDRFSPVAYLAVGALALSGLVTALSHLHTVAAVTGTTYGHLLTLKSALVGVLIVLSASHVRGLRPLIARAHRQMSAHTRAAAAMHEGLATLAGRLRVEAGIGALVLLCTALMSQTLPATTAAASTRAMTSPASSSGAATPAASISGTAVRGDLRVRLTIAPPAVGTATFTLRVWEAGQPVSVDTGAVLVHLSPAAQPLVRANLAAAAQGARFSARGSLGLTGTWRADVLVRTVRVNDYRTIPFTFTVGPGARFTAGFGAAPHASGHGSVEQAGMAGM